MSINNETFQSFEDLESLLKHWTSRYDNNVYDFGGMTSLLGACLDNLKEHALDAEIEEIKEYLTSEQYDFLKLITDNCSLNTDN